MPSQVDALSLSLTRGDALFRIQRALGLIPAEGLGHRATRGRGRAIAGGLDEPLLEHFGVHVRCLIAIPLLIVAEGVANGITSRVLPQFVRAGLVAVTPDVTEIEAAAGSSWDRAA